MKRLGLVSLGVALLLLVATGVFAGGKQETAAGGKYNEIQLVAVEMGWTGPMADKDFVTPEIEKRTGFRIKYEPLTVATGDALQQKLNLMAASKEIPEAFFGFSDAAYLDMVNSMGRTGLLWDVTSLAQGAKNLFPLLRDAMYLYRDPTSDAHYMLPTQTGKGIDFLSNPPDGPWYRKDWITRLGMKLPTTPEEFYTYCKRVKTEIGKTKDGQDVIPFALEEQLWGANASWFMRSRVNSAAPALWFDSKNNYELYWASYTDSPELIKAAKFWNRMYREGLLDPDALIIKDAQFKEKVSSARVGAFDYAYWVMNTLSDAAKAVDPDLFYVSAGYTKDPAVKNPADRYEWYAFPGSFSSLIFNKKVPEQTMKNFFKMMDYLATTEGQVLVNFGIEGKSFAYDANKKIKILDDFQKLTGNMDWNQASAYGVLYWQQLVLNFPAYADRQQLSPNLQRPDNKESWDNYKWYRDLYRTTVPTKEYFYQPGPVETKLKAALDAAYMEMWAKAIGADSEAAAEQVVHDWARTAKTLGIDDIVKERQEGIKKIDLSKMGG